LFLNHLILSEKNFPIRKGDPVMKKNYRKMVVPSFLLLSAFACFSQTNEWSITADATKGLITMTLSSPATTLQIENQIVLQVTNKGYPQSGSVRFQNGFARDLTSGELPLYWDKFNARQALWHYLESEGKTVSISVSSIPDDCFGKMTMITTQANKEFFGKLQKISGQNGQFGLLNDNACCGPTIFDKNVVSKIQQLK
jgi:hypothetical protein